MRRDDRAAEVRFNTHFRSDPDETPWARMVKAVKYALPPILIDAGRPEGRGQLQEELA